jgi:hypothetical protein
MMAGAASWSLQGQWCGMVAASFGSESAGHHGHRGWRERYRDATDGWGENFESYNLQMLQMAGVRNVALERLRDS